MDGYVDSQWLLDTVGVLYASGGDISENATSFQVDQDEGVFYNAQRKKLAITADTAIEASSLYHV